MAARYLACQCHGQSARAVTIKLEKIEGRSTPGLGVHTSYTRKYALTFLRLFVSNRHTANFGLGVHASYKS